MDGVLADGQVVSDRLVAQAVPHEGQDLDLARREQAAGFARRTFGEHFPRDALSMRGTEPLENVARAHGLGRRPVRLAKCDEGPGEEQSCLGFLVGHLAARIPVHRVLKKHPRTVRLAGRQGDRSTRKSGRGPHGRGSHPFRGRLNVGEGLSGGVEVPEPGMGACDDLVGIQPLQAI